MFRNRDLSSVGIFRLIRGSKIQFAGNAKLKIYGRLNCWSGKRMKKENRVFFENETEAIQRGFRPCKHCTKQSSLH
ncbi:MAG: metal-binding protein [Bacteroidetes bacterium]|nr:metal-binding protein [Bacteroidota bacterium]MBI3482325.1 metal-binding protein [Bacteroidota bacterium]